MTKTEKHGLGNSDSVITKDELQENSFACRKCGQYWSEESGASEGFICENCECLHEFSCLEEDYHDKNSIRYKYECNICGEIRNEYQSKETGELLDEYEILKEGKIPRVEYEGVFGNEGEFEK